MQQMNEPCWLLAERAMNAVTARPTRRWHQVTCLDVRFELTVASREIIDNLRRRAEPSLAVLETAHMASRHVV